MDREAGSAVDAPITSIRRPAVSVVSCRRAAERVGVAAPRASTVSSAVPPAAFSVPTVSGTASVREKAPAGDWKLPIAPIWLVGLLKAAVGAPPLSVGVVMVEPAACVIAGAFSVRLPAVTSPATVSGTVVFRLIASVMAVPCSGVTGFGNAKLVTTLLPLSVANWPARRTRVLAVTTPAVWLMPPEVAWPELLSNVTTRPMMLAASVMSDPATPEDEIVTSDAPPPATTGAEISSGLSPVWNSMGPGATKPASVLMEKLFGPSSASDPACPPKLATLSSVLSACTLGHRTRGRYGQGGGIVRRREVGHLAGLPDRDGAAGQPAAGHRGTELQRADLGRTQVAAVEDQSAGGADGGAVPTVSRIGSVDVYGEMASVPPGACSVLIAPDGVTVSASVTRVIVRPFCTDSAPEVEGLPTIRLGPATSVKSPVTPVTLKLLYWLATPATALVLDVSDAVAAEPDKSVAVMPPPVCVSAPCVVVNRTRALIAPPREMPPVPAFSESALVAVTAPFTLKVPAVPAVNVGSVAVTVPVTVRLPDVA